MAGGNPGLEAREKLERIYSIPVDAWDYDPVERMGPTQGSALRKMHSSIVRQIAKREHPPEPEPAAERKRTPAEKTRERISDVVRNPPPPPEGSTWTAPVFERVPQGQVDDEPSDYDRWRTHYPQAPEVDAGVRANLLYALACIRADMRSPNLTAASRSKLRTDETRTLTLIARLEQAEELREDRYVRDHPAFRAHVTRIVNALRPYPDAAKAVAEALAVT